MHIYMKVDGGNVALRGDSPHRGGSGWFELESFSERTPMSGIDRTGAGGRVMVLTRGKLTASGLARARLRHDLLTRVTLETVMPGRVPLWVVYRDVTIDELKVSVDDQDGDHLAELTFNYLTRQDGHGPLPDWSPARRGR